MTQQEIIEMAMQVGGTVSPDLIAFAKLVAAKEREHWKEIIDDQLRCITVLNEIVGGEDSTTTKNILDYSRMEERIKEAVAKEREACAKVCDEFCYGNTKILVEKAIRARGEA